MRLYIGPVRIPLWLWRIMRARVEVELIEEDRRAGMACAYVTRVYSGRKRLASRFGPLTPWMDRPIWRIG